MNHGYTPPREAAWPPSPRAGGGVKERASPQRLIELIRDRLAPVKVALRYD
jgi:hypothetical protein